MNKYFAAMLLAGSLSISVNASAKEASDIITAAADHTVQSGDVKSLPNAEAVTLNGTLVKHLNLDNYEFNDGTGLILLQIDEETWKAAGVRAGDKVQAVGEVAKHSYKPAGVRVVKLEKAL